MTIVWRSLRRLPSGLLPLKINSHTFLCNLCVCGRRRRGGGGRSGGADKVYDECLCR